MIKINLIFSLSQKNICLINSKCNWNSLGYNFLIVSKFVHFLSSKWAIQNHSLKILPVFLMKAFLVKKIAGVWNGINRCKSFTNSWYYMSGHNLTEPNFHPPHKSYITSISNSKNSWYYTVIIITNFNQLNKIIHVHS